GLHGRRTTLDHGGDVVEVTSAHFLLVRHEGVALFASSEFRLLHHFGVVLHAFAVGVGVSKLERVVPVDVDASQRDELVLVAQGRQVFLEGSDLLVVEVLLPVEGRRAVVRQQLARAGSVHSLREFTGEADVRHAGFTPHQVSVGSVSNAAADGLFQTVLDAVEAFLRALASDERLVVGIAVAGQQVGSFSVGAGQNDGGHAHHVGSETSSDQLLNGFTRRNQHLAAHVAALLHSSQLVFEVNTSSARSDHVLHQFESVQNATETGFSVSDDRQEVVDEAFVTGVDATAPLDFVSALERVVDAANHGGHRVVGVQRLVGVHGFRRVAVSGDLPTRQLHGFQASLGLLPGLTGGDGAGSVDVALLGTAVDLFPQLFSAVLGQGVLRLQAAAQTDDVSGGVAALDELPAGVFGPVFFQGSDLLFTSEFGHVDSGGWLRVVRNSTAFYRVPRAFGRLMSYIRHLFSRSQAGREGALPTPPKPGPSSRPPRPREWPAYSGARTLTNPYSMSDSSSFLAPLNANKPLRVTPSGLLMESFSAQCCLAKSARPVVTSVLAASTPSQPTTFTHLPGSRSL